MTSATWTAGQARAWVERHGGNLSALARRLGVHRTRLDGWAREGGRDLPPYVQAHMRTLDGLQAWLDRWRERVPPEAAAELDAVLRGEAPRED